jgi:hypothetical protein
LSVQYIRSRSDLISLVWSSAMVYRPWSSPAPWLDEMTRSLDRKRGGAELSFARMMHAAWRRMMDESRMKSLPLWGSPTDPAMRRINQMTRRFAVTPCGHVKVRRRASEKEMDGSIGSGWGSRASVLWSVRVIWDGMVRLVMSNVDRSGPGRVTASWTWGHDDSVRRMWWPHADAKTGCRIVMGRIM